MENFIENEHLRVKIKPKGAELFSIVSKENGLEYMWGADPAFWAKTSPILFPIVGTLKENAYYYQNQKYHLSRHGFARDEFFEVAELKSDSIVFLLKSSAWSLEKFPFPFELRITYQLLDNTLLTHYQVDNTGTSEMLFSIGAHPAFKVPLESNQRYEDYFLEFNQAENVGHWPITADGLIDLQPKTLLTGMQQLPLTRELFYNDALVLKHLNSDSVAIKSKTGTHGVEFNFSGFPYLGIWAQKNADFVCIEPWCGIADSVAHNQQLTTKEGIETLLPAQSWIRTWKAKFY